MMGESNGTPDHNVGRSCWRSLIVRSRSVAGLGTGRSPSPTGRWLRSTFTMDRRTSQAPRRIALLALINPVGPIADCDRRIRISKAHRLIFSRLGRSDAVCTAFFWSLRRLVHFAPGLAYRVLQQRVATSDRAVLAGDEVRANLRAALREGLRPGIDGARQDLRLYCAKWQLPLGDIDVPAVLWQGSDDAIVPPGAAYNLAETLPNCRLDVVQGGGHYWIFSGFERDRKSVV